MNTYRRHVVAPDVREVAESRGGGEGGGGWRGTVLSNRASNRERF